MIYISAESFQKNTSNHKELRGRGYQYLHKFTGQMNNNCDPSDIKFMKFSLIMKTSRQNKKKKKKFYM